MNMSDTPIEKSKKIMDAKGFSEGKKGERNKRQQFVRAVSIFLFVLVISFVAVLVKAYFDGEFRSVAALQKYIGKYGAFGPVFLTAFQAVQVVILVLPGFLGCAAGSVMFGPAVGFWCSYQPPLQMGVYYWPLRGIVLVPPEAGFATHFVLAAAISGSLLHPQVYRSLPVL